MWARMSVSLLAHVRLLIYNNAVFRRKALLKITVHLFFWCISLALVVLFTLWLKWFSPFGYQPPEGMPAIEQTSHHVFVFGTLKSPWVRWVVMGRKGEAIPAKLPGVRRENLTIITDPDAKTPGYVIKVTASELARLDHYERLGVRYERIKMQLADGQEAWVYRRL